MGAEGGPGADHVVASGGGISLGGDGAFSMMVFESMATCAGLDFGRGALTLADAAAVDGEAVEGGAPPPGAAAGAAAAAEAAVAGAAELPAVGGESNVEDASPTANS